MSEDNEQQADQAEPEKPVDDRSVAQKLFDQQMLTLIGSFPSTKEYLDEDGVKDAPFDLQPFLAFAGDGIDEGDKHAIEFIKANHEQPFFCYVPFNTPHSPMMVPDRWYDKFADFEPQMKHRDADKENVLMTRAALALCENIDWNVGRVLQTLDDLRLRDDTIVVYFSDNGPNSWRWNGGMKGRKGSIDEGGLQSPFFLRWPKHVNAGLRISQVAGAIDLLPTLTELAGVGRTSAKRLDGRSFAPVLQGTPTELLERSLFSFWRNKVSVRTQQYRLDNNDVDVNYMIATQKLG